MDLDRAYIEPLIDDWMEHLQQTMKKHEQGQEQSVNAIDFAMPFVGDSTYVWEIYLVQQTKNIDLPQQ